MSRAIKTNLYCWQINQVNTVNVVAATIEEAIEIFKEHCPNKEISSVDKLYWLDLLFSKEVIGAMKKQIENERSPF